MIQISRAVADSGNRVGFFDDAKRTVRVKRARGESGVALVEFALLLPFLAMLVFATIDVGRVYSLQSRLKNASREGAAWAQVKPDQFENCAPGATTIRERTQNEDADLVTSAGFAVTYSNETTGTAITGCGTNVAGGQRVKVQTQANFQPVTFFITAITGSPIVIKGSTEVEVQGA